MGSEVNEAIPRRLCAVYTANGISLPKAEHRIDDGSWFQAAGHEGKFVFGESTEPLQAYRDKWSFLGGLYHPSGPKADPHVCSDMWLTGAPLHNPTGIVQLGGSGSGSCFAHTALLPPTLPGAVDRCGHRFLVAGGNHLVRLGGEACTGRKPSQAGL
jgi:hypothetical protein